MLQATGYPAEISDIYSAISAEKKKNGKQILVICLFERHKDNNDRSRKKSPNLYSPDHAYAWTWGQDEISQRLQTSSSHMGHVRDEFQMRRSKMGKQTQLEKKPVSLV